MREDAPSVTAERVAATRAIEFRRPANKRICSDPLARHFLSGELARVQRHWVLRKLFDIRTERICPGVIGSVAARTRYFDDCLEAALQDGTEQLVILGAGYDTRAYRIEGVKEMAKVFEVDHPATQHAKTMKLKKLPGSFTARVVHVPVRFNSEDFGSRLFEYGYDSSLKTFFIWEGVTYYISAKAVDDTLDFVANRSGEGSAIVFDYFPPSVAEGTCQLREARAMQTIFKELGEGVTFGVDPDKIEDFLSRRGFAGIRNMGSREYKARYFTGGNRNRTVSSVFYFVHATVKKRRKEV